MTKSGIIALAIGGAISATLIALDPMTGFALTSWQLPGAAAAFVFWGVLGWSTSAGVVVCWLVNALLYSVPILVVIRIMAALMRAATK